MYVDMVETRFDHALSVMSDAHALLCTESPLTMLR